MLYEIFIAPIESLLKFIFEVSFSFSHSYLMATVMLSFSVFLLTLPFYYWADKFQKEEREITKKLQPKIDEFKSVYSGSKLHAVINTLYRQNNYHPIFALRSIMGLLIQLPFFMAAYHFLSTYQPIVGVETWLFKDLGKPDGWIDIGGIQINVMPFIMTIVNLISGFIFTRGMKKSEEIQIWILALIFLVLLYDSPSLLVFYWTMNNFFSLIKNIIESRKNINFILNNNYFIEKYHMLKKLIKQVAHRYLLEMFFIVLVLYVYVISIIGYIPYGINYEFLSHLKQTLFYTIGILIVLIFILRIFKFRLDLKIYQFDTVRWSDLLLILWPFAVIVHYVMINYSFASSSEVLYIIVGSILFFIFSILFLPILLSKIISRVLLSGSILVLLVILSYMPIIARFNSWYLKGDYTIQLILFFVILATFLYMYVKHQKFLKFLILIFFLSTVSRDIFWKNNDNKEKVSQEERSQLFDEHFKQSPNIYLLTYDAYVNNETMKQYGIDNSKQEQFLVDNGFKIYKEIYSIASKSIGTMKRVLDMSYEFPKKDKVIIGKGSVYKVLKKHGYKVGIVMRDTYFYRNEKPTLDFSFPLDFNTDKLIVLNSILEGQFRFNPKAAFADREEVFIHEKRKYMTSSENPRFIYTHTGPGHSQNSGKCLPNEIGLFKKRLLKANEEMKEDIEAIMKNDPNSIVIVNGDHGPYLTGNCIDLSRNDFLTKDNVTRLDLQDRYGTFLAIKWPKSMNVYDENLTVLQDLFPVVFASLMENKSIFEKSKIKPVTDGISTSGATVNNGVIMDGKNKGEQLFLKKE